MIESRIHVKITDPSPGVLLRPLLDEDFGSAVSVLNDLSDPKLGKLL